MSASPVAETNDLSAIRKSAVAAARRTGAANNHSLAHRQLRFGAA